jgi:Zn-dependent protease
MIKPAFLIAEDQRTVVGQLFGTPVVVRAWTGLPMLELVAWMILSWVAGKKLPDLPWYKRLYAGAITTIVLLGSEWCHNLAHAAAASRIGKPVDAIRIFFGTPLLIYYDINDQQVTPVQHITRALGGPFFNAVMIPFAWLASHYSHDGTLTRYVANFALGTNCFISMVSLLPIPGIDGGPILKWSLVEAGRSAVEADEVVKRVNLVMGSGLSVAAGAAIKKRRKWIAFACATFAVTSLAIGLGLLKEQKNNLPL